MRLSNIKVRLSLVIPFGHPDKNGIKYSREAVEKAVRALFDSGWQLPIVYRDCDSYKDGTVVGNTIGETGSVSWNNEQQVCEVVVDGIIYYGGTECIVNEISDDVVTDFSITSVGLSQ